MINLCSLLKSFSSICCIPCIITPSPAMALSKWQFTTAEDPWKVSVFVSAIVELFLSILLFLGAAIAFVTSRIVKFFGLEPPCTYIGCSHPLHLHNEGNNERYTLGLKDHAVMEIGVHGCKADLGCGKEHQCSCSDSLPCKRWNQSSHPRHQSILRTHPDGRLNEGYPALLSARSSAESICGSAAEDHFEIFQVSADSEQEREPQATVMKAEDHECSGSDSLFRKRRGRSKRPRRRDFARACFMGKLNKSDPALLSAARSNPESNGRLNAEDRGGLNAEGHDGSNAEDYANPESNGGFNAEGHGGLKADGHGGLKADGHDGLNAKDYGGLKAEGEHEETDRKLEDFFIHNLALVHHSEATEGHTLIEDAIQVSSKVDVSRSTDVNPALLSVRSSPESNGGFNAENHCKMFQVRASFEQERECEKKDKDLDDHDTLSAQNTLVEDATTVHASKGQQTYDADYSSECVKAIGPMVNVCNTEHSNMGLLPCEDNQCIIQFGSIIARTSIKDGLANNTCVDSGRIDDRGLQNVVETGGGSLQKMGRNESSTDTKIFQFENNGFGDAISAKKSLNQLTPRDDIITSTKESCSTEVFEGTSMPIEEQASSTPSLKDDEGEEAAVAEDEQEEGLDALKIALQAERSMLVTLEAELENERNAAAVATSEAMAMISRLQEEKSAMQMEVAQLQRMSGERADYDEQAMAVLKDILVKKETENMALEMEIELYREKLFAGNSGEPNGGWSKENGSLAHQSHCKPLLLIGQELELRSPFGATRNRGSPWIPHGGTNKELEELNTISVCQNTSKRSRDFSASAEGIRSEQFCDIDHAKGGLYGHRDSCQQSKKMGRCSPSTDDETLLAREGPWVLAKDLQELPGKEELRTGKPWTSQADEGWCLASSLGKKMATSSLTESCGTQHKCGIKSDCSGEVDGGCGGFLPIHDVYEVYTVSNRSPPPVEERDLPEVFDVALTTNKELQPRMLRQIAEFPPRFVSTTKPIVSEEIPSTPTSMVQTAGWDIEKSFYTEDLCERHDLRSLSLLSREERRTELEEIKQLAVRLKALEEDRDLLRVTVESVKHRDAELNLLQEISKHLRELRMIDFTGVSEGAILEETSITSPNRMRPLKKRRCCSGLGQARTLLQHQKSV